MVHWCWAINMGGVVATARTRCVHGAPTLTCSRQEDKGHRVAARGRTAGQASSSRAGPCLSSTHQHLGVTNTMAPAEAAAHNPQSIGTRLFVKDEGWGGNAAPPLCTLWAMHPIRSLTQPCGGGGVQTMASRRSPLTRRHGRNLSESRIRAVQCYDCPTRRCSSGHNT
jgi:hypothetical protein